jgi:hypothetical protein
MDIDIRRHLGPNAGAAPSAETARPTVQKSLTAAKIGGRTLKLRELAAESA